MTGTEVIALAGVIGTPVVALAGYAFNRQLALDTRKHELEVRRRERAYEARHEAYQHVLEWALVLMQQVELTDPILTFEGMPAPPDSPPAEVFNRMVVELAAFGSPEVRTAAEAFREAVRSFFLSNSIANMIRDQGGGAHRWPKRSRRETRRARKRTMATTDSQRRSTRTSRTSSGHGLAALTPDEPAPLLTYPHAEIVTVILSDEDGEICRRRKS